MSLIKVKHLKTGQVLQKDAISSKGRLLLTAGIRLDKMHLEILQTWGVVEVSIVEDETINDESASNFESLPI